MSEPSWKKLDMLTNLLTHTDEIIFVCENDEASGEFTLDEESREWVRSVLIEAFKNVHNPSL